MPNQLESFRFALSSLFLCCRSNPAYLSPANWKVYGGAVSLDRLPAPYLVKKIIINENYDTLTNDQDVALLVLESPVVFNGQSHLNCFVHLSLVLVLRNLTSHLWVSWWKPDIHAARDEFNMSIPSFRVNDLVWCNKLCLCWSGVFVLKQYAVWPGDQEAWKTVLLRADLHSRACDEACLNLNFCNLQKFLFSADCFILPAVL